MCKPRTYSNMWVHFKCFLQVSKQCLWDQPALTIFERVRLAQSFYFYRSVDASKALAIGGVHTYVDVDDVPGRNRLGPSLLYDDVLFADSKV